jgi:hypothetical protein
MCEQMRQYGTLSEIHQRALLIALIRLYGARWRPSDPEGPGAASKAADLGGVRPLPSIAHSDG